VKSARLIRQRRGNPLLREKVHDPYRAGEKLREATRCPQCGVRYKNGRWAWPKMQTFALKSQHCPACRRINDRYPAGELVLSGEFPDAYRAEVLSRARNVEASERSEHPLHRIMSIEKRGEGTVITTTDIHLPHRIGHALQDAWGGQLKTHYDREGYFTRVQWERNE
jgi:NMD protein affecting ribosome stability and mRNA decay